MMDENPYISAKEAESAKRAKKVEAKRIEKEAEDIKVILSTVEGRRFMWHLLGRCKVFSSVAHPMELIQYNAGMQDVGHYLQKRVIDCDPDIYLKMMTESKKGEYDV